MSRGAAPYPSRKFQWKTQRSMADIFRHPDHSQFIAIQNFIRVFRGYRTAARPPNGDGMPSGMYHPGKRPVCGWRLRCAGSPSLHGHRENPKGIGLYRLASSIALPEARKPFAGRSSTPPIDTPTRANGRKPAKKRPHTALAGGERAEHIIKLEI